MTRRQMLKRLVPHAPRRPKPPRQPDPGESLIQEKLTPLIEALVHPDESCRWAGAAITSFARLQADRVLSDYLPAGKQSYPGYAPLRQNTRHRLEAVDTDACANRDHHAAGGPPRRVAG
jgi:hypothetical protein